MTPVERVEALDDETTRAILVRLVEHVEANGAPRPLAAILRKWSLLGDGERLAIVGTNRPIGLNGSGKIHVAVDDYDTHETVRRMMQTMMPGVGVDSVQFMRKEQGQT